MASVIPQGSVAWGLQLPVQAQSTAFAQPWEATAGPEELEAVARAADRAGALYVGVCDHVAIPQQVAGTMGTTWYDTVATLGWLAARTSKVHLLSHVYVLAYRPALMVAKSFATLDVLSAGRVILGVGAGHVEAEFDALGADFANRGKTVEQSIPVIRAAFGNDFVPVGDIAPDPAHTDLAGIDLAGVEPAGVDPSGAGLASAGAGRVSVAVAPRPHRPGGPPIWVGGSSQAAIRRAALLGDGWLPQGPPKMGMSKAVEFIARTRALAGLPEAFDVGANGGPIFVGTPDFEVPGYTMSGTPVELGERLGRLTARGVNQIQLQFLGRDAAQVCEQIERFGSEVAPLLQG